MPLNMTPAHYGLVQREHLAALQMCRAEVRRRGGPDACAKEILESALTALARSYHCTAETSARASLMRSELRDLTPTKVKRVDNPDG